MTSAACLDAEVVFGATVNATVPFPVPATDEVIVSQPAPLDAVQAQAVVIVAVPLPPAAGKSLLSRTAWPCTSTHSSDSVVHPLGEVTTT